MLLGAGKLTVAVPVAGTPWEFCTVYEKVAVPAEVLPGTDKVNPPWASISTVPVLAPRVTAGGVAGTTTLRVRLFLSVLPSSRPGEAILIKLAVVDV